MVATPGSTATTKISWAMQFPDTNTIPGGDVGNFLDAFLRGNRDDQDRLPDSSLSQALDLMNDTYVGFRIKASGTAAAGNQSLLAQALAQRVGPGAGEHAVYERALASAKRSRIANRDGESAIRFNRRAAPAKSRKPVVVAL